MNRKRIAYQIIKQTPVNVQLMNTKYINRVVRRYTKKRVDFELIKMYIYQIKRREARRARSYK
ncbi:hypothetical protein FVP40_08155 [Staphylococcus aureus]|nr:hypothetical protein [Staphylococcus aureus]MCB4392257.1 hypothetical protein [Staphylococcus aureus]